MNSDDLSVLIRSRVPILVMDSSDEAQVIKTVLRASGHPSEPVEGTVLGATRPNVGPPVFQWTVTDGLRRLDINFGTPQRSVTEPAEIAKITWVIYLAYSLAKKQDKVKHFSIGFLPHLAIERDFHEMPVEEVGQPVANGLVFESGAQIEGRDRHCGHLDQLLQDFNLLFQL